MNKQTKPNSPLKRLSTYAATAGLALLLLLGTAPTFASAQNSGADAAKDVAKKTAQPNEIVETAIVDMFAAVKAEKEQSGTVSVQRVREFVEVIVMPIVDEQMMSQWVLGRNWNQMTNPQRREFIHLFKELLIRTYASALSDYVHLKTNFFPFKPEANAQRATVRMEIIRPDGPPIPFQFRLRQNKDEWKVYDALVEGISLVQNYRTTFADIIKSSGIEGMLKRLKDETAAPEASKSE